jgi:hypothetical protein
MVRGVIMLNATPFWTVPMVRALQPLKLGQVPLNTSLTTAINNRLFAVMKDPSWIQRQLKLVRSMCHFRNARFQDCNAAFKSCLHNDLLICDKAHVHTTAIGCTISCSRACQHACGRICQDTNCIGRAMFRNLVSRASCTIVVLNASEQHHASQVYKDHSMIDPSCVERMCAACDHPHAAEAFLSIFLSPRGRVGMGVMARELAHKGIPLCQLHGACPPCTTS